MQNEKVILQGGGEHARVVLDTLLATGAEVLALFDPKYSGELFGIPQLGKYDPGFTPEAKAVVAIGDNALRREVARQTCHAFTVVIHPTAVASRFCQIGEGSMLLHGVIVQARVQVGKHVIINTGACIDHDCSLADYVHIAPGCTLCGTVQVGEGTLVGAGSVILPGIKIGNWSVIGAGSVVTRNVPDGVVVAGNPARLFRQVK
jgi:sugar O-acyltransferase (sialic acid O-acetyltransferase NeuD family)